MANKAPKPKGGRPKATAEDEPFVVLPPPAHGYVPTAMTAPALAPVSSPRRCASTAQLARRFLEVADELTQAFSADTAGHDASDAMLAEEMLVEDGASCRAAAAVAEDSDRELWAAVARQMVAGPTAGVGLTAKEAAAAWRAATEKASTSAELREMLLVIGTASIHVLLARWEASQRALSVDASAVLDSRTGVGRAGAVRAMEEARQQRAASARVAYEVTAWEGPWRQRLGTSVTCAQLALRLEELLGTTRERAGMQAGFLLHVQTQDDDGQLTGHWHTRVVAGVYADGSFTIGGRVVAGALSRASAGESIATKGSEPGLHASFVKSEPPVQLELLPVRSESTGGHLDGRAAVTDAPEESSAAGKVLPPGWREQLHHANARTYSTFHGPNGEKARSIAEAIRTHDAAGGGAVSSAGTQAPRALGFGTGAWGALSEVRFKQLWVGPYPPRSSTDGKRLFGRNWRPLPAPAAEPEAPRAPRAAALKQLQTLASTQQTLAEVDEDGDEDSEDGGGRGPQRRKRKQGDADYVASDASEGEEGGPGDPECMTCHSRGHADQMLLCDACDHGYHIYCLKPRLYEVPAEDWFCPPCSRSSRLRHRAKALEAEVEAEARPGRGLQEGAHLLTRQTRGGGGGGGGGGVVKRGRSQRECERELAELDAKLDDVRDARPRRRAASKAVVGARNAEDVDEEDVEKDEEDEAGDLKGGRPGRTRR